MKAENLHAWLRVRVVRRFEPDFMDAHFREEYFHESDQTPERKPKVCNHPFDLVELGEMGGVNAFVTENTIDRKVAGWPGVGGKFMKHVGRDGGCVSAKNETERFVFIPRVAVPY